MAQSAIKAWTLDEFFAWQERQAERYELVGGVPVRMMAGARNAHDDIVVNVLTGLQTRLRGSGCRVFTGDGGLETYPGQLRRPDAGVDCGRRDPDGYKAQQPRLVVEVLSPSTRDFDTHDKLAEYKSVASLDYILIVEPNAPEIVLWTRLSQRSWDQVSLAGMEAVAEMPALAVELPLSAIYEGVVFPPDPRVAGP